MSYPRFIGKVENSTVILSEEEFHHLKVKRLKEGDFFELNDLKGNIYLCKIEKISKNELKAYPIEKIHQKEEKLKIDLYLCIPNQLSKIDDLIPFLSELGVDKLIPVICKNSAIKQKQIEKKLNKWEKIALNSIKQCKRLYPLKIESPKQLKDINPDSDIKFLFYEKEKEKTLKQFCDKKVDSISIFIGNEGGFKEEEVLFLEKKGFIPLSLGNLILKMETAVITAVANIKFCFED